MTRIAIITGSARPGRFNPQVANWLTGFAQQRRDADFELVDIVDYNLPLLDEEVPPSMGQYAKDHTKRWATTIDSFDGYVFVSPEYNHGIPGALKNAIDFLFAEWHYKPAGFVSYGSAAGGSRAVEHLRGVMAELNIYDVREQVLIPNYFASLDDNGNYDFAEVDESSATAMLDKVVFWGERMKPAREEWLARQ